MENFDYGIIGGGPAGYTAGMLLAKQGHSVVLFEKDKLGGTCLNRGCIPTKSFIHSSEIFATLTHAGEYGISFDNINFDFSKVVEKKDKTVEKVRKALELSVKNSGVKVIYKEARIVDKNTISTNEGNYRVEKIISACGSKPRELKGLEFDGEFILSSDDILNIKQLPKKVLIVGSGAIGIEWARILSNFGVDVCILEACERLLPIADIEVSKRIERIFKQKGIKFYLNNTIKEIKDKVAVLANGDTIAPDFILSAAGREAVCADDSNCKLLGDACGKIQLAHFAIHQAAELVLGVPYNKQHTPSVIYGEPEIAWVGLREQDCDESYTIKKLPVSALGKAWCDNSIEGFIKVITKDNKIYGAHIISKEASALIHTFLVAMENNLSINDLKKCCFAHPTYSEGIYELL